MIEKIWGDSSARFNLFLAVAGGVLLGVSFPPVPFSPLAHVGLLPLLVLLDRLNRWGPIARYSYLSMFVFHLLTLYWVGGFTHMKDGYLMASGVSLLLAHPMFFWIPIFGFVFVRRQFGETVSLVSFPFLWVGFEYFHALGEFSFPWLTLGNSQAYDLVRIQIAEYVSVYGISFLLVAFNVLAFVFVKYVALKIWPLTSQKGLAVLTGLLVVYLVPLAFGSQLMKGQEAEGTTLRVGIVQPNIDPYEKWGEGMMSKWDSYVSQLEILYNETRALSADSVDLVVWPETAIPFYLRLPQNEAYLSRLHGEIDAGRTPVFTGLPDGEYQDSANASPTARWVPSAGKFFEGYNSATLILPGSPIDRVYHKVVLVPFAERIPHAEKVTFLIEPLKWGVGISSWGKGESQLLYDVPLRSGGSGKFGGMICYELVFPSYVRGFVNDGAQFLIIISNDSWWGYTSGAFQLAAYSSIRAVEMRRWIVRCANGGISGVIGPSGTFFNKTEFLESATVTGILRLRDDVTFYARHGDLVGKASLSAFALLIAIGFLNMTRRRQRSA